MTPEHSGKWKKELRRSKCTPTPIHGSYGVGFTDEKMVLAFASFEKQFSPNRWQDDDLDWVEQVEEAAIRLVHSQGGHRIRLWTSDEKIGFLKH